MFAKESTKRQRDVFAEESSEMAVWSGRSQPASKRTEANRIIARIRDHDWTVGLLCALCDIVCWVLVYGFVGYMRRDAFFVSAFEIVLVDCITLIVIIQALYIVGGYNRDTEARGLTYTAEHILAVAAAAVISSLLIYSSAAYDAAMKPSRGVLLISFVLFVPISLLYRRFFRRTIVASAAQRAFLVIGSGELATQFYQAYKQSPNQQQLEFVDNDTARVGSTIAGEGSPTIQGGIAAKLTDLDRRYSGVILAQSVDRLGQDLIERLVRTQFQRTRVYTLESFYEAHWRHVPMHTIDPFWPLQMGFQLARISPYHVLKRLFDVVASALLLVISCPLMVMSWGLIRLTSPGPAIIGQLRVAREGQRFIAHKFRTMTAPVDADNGDIYTRENDSRITGIGKWLRKLRLDEVPRSEERRVG